MPAGPTPLPFDRARALTRVAAIKVKPQSSIWPDIWRFEGAGITGPLSREEAHFWFAAMTRIEIRDAAATTAW